MMKLLGFFYAGFFHTVYAVVLVFLFKCSSVFNLYLWFKNVAVYLGNWWFCLSLRVNLQISKLLRSSPGVRYFIH